MLPPNGVVDIWTQRICGQQAPADAQLSTLTDDSLARARTFLRPGLGNTFLRSRIFERAVLARYVDHEPGELRIDRTCLLCGAAHGKPRLIAIPDGHAGAGLDFNLSHTRGVVVAAVVRPPHRVGIDVEHLNAASAMPSLVASVYSPEEIATGDHGAPGILAHWVRKEALLKATGHGLAIAPGAVTLQFEAAGRCRLVRAPHLSAHESWYVVDLRLGPDHVGAVAVDTNIRQLSINVLEGGDDGPLDAVE
jgi:4'-phosphopantetheinyl transferase